MRARHPHEHIHRRHRESLISSFSEHRSDILSVGCPGVGSPGPPDDPTTVHLSQGDLSGAGRDESHGRDDRCGASARVVVCRFFLGRAAVGFLFPRTRRPGDFSSGPAVRNSVRAVRSREFLGFRPGARPIQTPKNGRFWVMGQVRQVRLQVSWASGFSIHSLGPRHGSHSTARAQWASRVATCRLTFLSHLWDGIVGWSGPHDREPVIRGVDGEPWSAAAAPPS